MPPPRPARELHYLATNAQWNDSELAAEIAEHRYVLSLQVAFQVPLPLGFDATFERIFSSGMHPVYPALTIFNLSWISGELTDSGTQPLPATAIPTSKAIQDLHFLIALPSVGSRSHGGQGKGGI